MISAPLKLIQYRFVLSAGREVQGDSVKSVPPLFPSLLFPRSHRELQQQVEKVEPLSTPKVASVNCLRSQILVTASANVFTFKTSGKHLSKHLYLPFLYLCSAANRTNEDNGTLLRVRVTEVVCQMKKESLRCFKLPCFQSFAHIQLLH